MGIMYSYLIYIKFTWLYGFMYSYLMLIFWYLVFLSDFHMVVWFRVFVSNWHSYVWLQVFLSHTNCLYTTIHGFKYSFLILIINKQLHGFKYSYLVPIILLWWPIYTIMNSSSFINTNPVYSRRDFFPAVEPDRFQTDTSTCSTNTVISYICSVFQYTWSFYFLFFCVFFLTATNLYTIINGFKYSYLIQIIYTQLSMALSIPI